MNLKTLTAYLIFIFQGLTAPLGCVMIMEIAEKYGAETSVIGYILTLGLIGGSIAALFSGKLLEKFNITTLIFTGIFILILAVLTIFASPTLTIFAAGIVLLNIGSWVLVPVGNYLIISQYAGKARSSQLTILNFTFSIGALATPTLAGFLIKNSVSWEIVFTIPFLSLIILAAMTSRIVETSRADSDQTADSKQSETWGLGVYLSGIALGVYCILEGSYTSWIVVHLRENIHIDIVAASLILTTFFVCQAAGRLASAFFVKFMPLGYYILLCTAIAFTAVSFILFSSNYTVIFILTIILSLGAAGLYPSILSFGTQQIKTASPHLLTFFISSGMVGAIISMLLTSFLKQTMGTFACIAAGSVSALIIIGLIGFTIYHKRKPKLKTL